MNVYDVLVEIKEALNDIEVKSIKIGLEKGLNAKDCPFLRIVPRSSQKQEYNRFSLDFIIVFGVNIKNDYDELYKTYFETEENIRKALDLKQFANGICKFKETITDEDMLTNLKSAVMEFEIEGIRWS